MKRRPCPLCEIGRCTQQGHACVTCWTRLPTSLRARLIEAHVSGEGDLYNGVLESAREWMRCNPSAR